MSASVFIQLILLLNVFIIGALTPVIYKNAKAHFEGNKDKPEPETRPDAIEPTVHLSSTAKDHLLKEAENKFHTSLEHSVSKLSHDLDATSNQIDGLVKHLATEIVGNELERYRAELAQLRQKAQEDLNNVKTVIDSHKAEITSGLEQEIQAEKQKMLEKMEAEKQHLTEQINTKLADAVASFLLEALGHNVDLGSQSAYLTSLLEEHKAEFVKEVSDEPKPTE